ncbi:MarR family winged helix-turn-helix transcriptional regulator [Maricaulis sp. D1M11]|uniref:MarR family winged helix-turn-helix transcriptional regulator n=1 Tax=Maricaulis sp. D1M11 TaxID=3076117 RepID=UPI0039B6DAEF
MFERCIFFNIQALARSLNARWEHAFAEFGLTPAQGYMLRLVLNEPGQSQQAIARGLQLEKSTVTRLLSGLEGKGLIERKPVAGNARENAIHGTAAARQIHDALNATGQRLYDQMTDTVGENTLKGFVQQARTINDQI